MLSLNFTLPDWVLLFVIAPLATWRITNIIYQEKLGELLHRLVGDDQRTFLGYLVNCFYCLSVWVAPVVTVLVLVFPVIILPFAVSSVAIFIHQTLEVVDQWLLLRQKQ